MIATACIHQPVRYYVPTLLSAQIEMPPRVLSLSSDTFSPATVNLPSEAVSSARFHLNSVFYGDAEFRSVVQDILVLTVPGDESSDDLPASSYAVAMALYMLPASRFALGANWIAPHATTDSYGGLRLSWVKQNREVRAIIPQDSVSRKRYIYWQDEERYGSISNFTPSTLVAQLEWLNGSSGEGSGVISL